MSKAKTILIVEDEKDLVTLIRYRLEKKKFHVLAASDAETGLELARRSKPDLILLDVALPKMDGFEFLRKMRSKIHIPIILLSAKANETDRALGLKLGADDYVVKPFSFEALLPRIAAQLHRRPGGSST